VLFLSLALGLLNQHINKLRWIIIIISVQDICNYIPETDHVSRIYNVAAILSLQYMVHDQVLYLYISTYKICAQCFPGVLCRCFLNDFEIIPFAPINTGITCDFTFHIHFTSVARSLYFKIFLASFFIYLKKLQCNYHRLWYPVYC
jgi:hypothetical protein